MKRAWLNKQKIPVKTLVFGNFCFDYYSYRLGSNMDSMFWLCQTYAKQTHLHAKQIIFILAPSKLYANIKTYTELPSGNRLQHVLQSAAVCAGVQQCSKFFAQLWCLPFPTF